MESHVPGLSMMKLHRRNTPQEWVLASKQSMSRRGFPLQAEAFLDRLLWEVFHLTF